MVYDALRASALDPRGHVMDVHCVVGEVTSVLGAGALRFSLRPDICFWAARSTILIRGLLGVGASEATVPERLREHKQADLQYDAKKTEGARELACVKCYESTYIVTSGSSIIQSLDEAKSLAFLQISRESEYK